MGARGGAIGEGLDYVRREPERTVLHQLVRHELATFLEAARGPAGEAIACTARPIPRGSSGCPPIASRAEPRRDGYGLESAAWISAIARVRSRVRSLTRCLSSLATLHFL